MLNSRCRRPGLLRKWPTYNAYGQLTSIKPFTSMQAPGSA